MIRLSQHFPLSRLLQNESAQHPRWKAKSCTYPESHMLPIMVILSLRLYLKLKYIIKIKWPQNLRKRTQPAAGERPQRHVSPSVQPSGNRTVTSRGWDREATAGPQAQASFSSLLFITCHHLSPCVDRLTHDPSAPVLCVEGSLSTFPGGVTRRRPWPWGFAHQNRHTGP